MPAPAVGAVPASGWATCIVQQFTAMVVSVVVIVPVGNAAVAVTDASG